MKRQFIVAHYQGKHKGFEDRCNAFWVVLDYPVMNLSIISFQVPLSR